MEQVKATGRLKRYADWQNSGCNLWEFLQVGDCVDGAFRSYFLEVLFPAYFNSSMIQMGDPFDHVRDRPRYLTLEEFGREWLYTGPRHVRERVEFVLEVV